MQAVKIKSKIFSHAHSFTFQNGVLLMVILLFTVGLKYHYSQACSDDLAWILGPTADLVEIISGIQFEKEAHSGYISYAHRIIIAPACAGVNFFIIAFCMAVFSGILQIRHRWLKFLWLTASAVSSYLLTIFVNALRIILSIYSYKADIYSGWITAQRLHRMEGTLIYFFFLCLFYMIIKKVIRYYRLKESARRTRGHRGRFIQSDTLRWMLSDSVPLFWYSLMTLVIPLLNASYNGNEAQFVEHSWMVISGCLIVLVTLSLFRAGWNHISYKIHGNHEAKDPYRRR